MGIKYPQSKFSAGLTLAGSVTDFDRKKDSARTSTGVGLRHRLQPQEGLRPDSYGSRAPSPTSTATRTPAGLLREPGSVTDFDRKEDSARTPSGVGLHHQLQLPGLLRESNSVTDSDRKKDSARTPTGAGLRHQLRPQGRLRPDSYGSRAPSPTSTAGKLRPDSYGSRTSHLTSTAEGLRPDSYGSRAPSPTSTVRRTPAGLLREPGSITDFDCKEGTARTPTGAGLRHQLQPPGLLLEPGSVHDFD